MTLTWPQSKLEWYLPISKCVMKQALQKEEKKLGMLRKYFKDNVIDFLYLLTDELPESDWELMFAPKRTRHFTLEIFPTTEATHRLVAKCTVPSSVTSYNPRCSKSASQIVTKNSIATTFPSFAARNKGHPSLSWSFFTISLLISRGYASNAALHAKLKVFSGFFISAIKKFNTSADSEVKFLLLDELAVYLLITEHFIHY